VSTLHNKFWIFILKKNRFFCPESGIFFRIPEHIFQKNPKSKFLCLEFFEKKKLFFKKIFFCPESGFFSGFRNHLKKKNPKSKKNLDSHCLPGSMAVPSAVVAGIMRTRVKVVSHYTTFVGHQCQPQLMFNLVTQN
jgi:hypothetical protein